MEIARRSSDLVPQLGSGQQEALKWFAFGCMVVEHALRVLVDFDFYPGIAVGRPAFPLFCFLIAYNVAVREVAPGKYMLPLLVAGLLTQPLYVWVWQESGVVQLNILFTLLWGVISLAALQFMLARRWHGYLGASLTAVLLTLPLSLISEYVLFGPSLLVAVYVFLKVPRRTTLAIVVGVACLVNINLPPTLMLIAGASALLPILWTASDLRVRRLPRYTFYVLYPVHLLLLGLAAKTFV